MKPTFAQLLGNSLPSVYSGSLGNEDISLKAFSSKCCNHSEQINKAAFTPGLSSSHKSLRHSWGPAFPVFHLLPCSLQADGLCICCWQVPTFYFDKNAFYAFHSPAVRTTRGNASVLIRFPTNQFLYAYSAWKGRPWVAACLLGHAGLLTYGWGCCSLSLP